jgi:hypothetical protein
MSQPLSVNRGRILFESTELRLEDVSLTCNSNRNTNLIVSLPDVALLEGAKIQNLHVIKEESEVGNDIV